MSLTVPPVLPSRTEVEARLADPAALARAEAMRVDDFDRGETPQLKPAAVLVPIVWHEAGPGILLTVRSARLSSHAGQVAFPGGRLEPGETAEVAALREAAEEVGLDPRLPTLVGTLPDHRTGTGYRVTPVVAFLDPPLDLTPDPGEVQAIFELPLATVLDPAAAIRRQGEWRGRRREYWVWPHDEHLVWGATAAILMNLSRVLRG
ncbi:CoA pyrophosphatase [Falsiroseomonas sp. CW058]|uniref:CoA pyrophosphatase n=1 Tax=Falsiroseomonas sp. CW058 TaxID=3388664 RepID=UPI003D3141CC